MTGNVSDDVTVTWFGHSVEQVTGVVAMQSRDAWWVIWRTSWTLMVEKTLGRTASLGATSAEAATIADSFVPETAARQVVSWLVWSTARAVVDVAVVVADVRDPITLPLNCSQAPLIRVQSIDYTLIDSWFIPYSFIEKEASHVQGFSPELAVVTIGGGKELEEKLVVRPTSETIVNHMFTKWIQSYRDLPLMINQWANVTRWEMRTKPFIRTLEFLWQEGHTAHATLEEAEKEAMQMIDVYTKFAYEQAAIPVIPGRKSRVETFAGADRTYTIEAMMGDKKALQAGTSHNLGQNFSRAFETQFMDENGQLEHVWQTSWAISTRFVGGIIMTHGDDAGLMLPPRIAPIQVVIVPIWKKGDEKGVVMEAVASVQNTLKEAGIRVKVDDSELRTPGWKFNFYEMKGVPIRIELGPRDVKNRSVVLSRRDVPGKQGKEFGISMEPSILVDHIKDRLEEIQASLLQKAITFRDSNIVDVNSYGELKEVISEGKWARGPWSASDADELKVKEETSATIRCFPFDQPEGAKKCFMTGNPADEVAIFAKSY
ncbi:Prolyl-tRNA synthetase [Triticum urartu]|uniref:proline--tRNA ligase n=1 Tax=Triticum urartu TaxID=4572 RepID=M8AJ38_TRIUA|nr:Prolyl-tRNA synthetase [Triticum urartu]